MKIRKRENPFGGSAGGGGYDYQAEAWALAAAKILAQESLNWIESECNRVPISIRMETGGGGDDILITLQSGVKIEVQAKRGLKRGNRLWRALIALARVLKDDVSTYGVLLTNTESSNTIRIHLKDGIVRVGQGLMEDLHEIIEDFLKHLHKAGIDDLSICSRIRIVVRDFAPGSSGEEETLATLRKVLTDPNKARAARNTLVSDGFDQIKLRGIRHTNGLISVLKQAGLSLSTTTKNQLILRRAFIDWSIKINETISIPSLNITLPMQKAWVNLGAMASPETPEGSKSLVKQIQDYHEWHRLTDTRRTSDILDIERTVNKERLLVVVGGPGSGKSTLLRRLAWSWSIKGRLVLRVSLRAIALRTRKGATFEEALLAVAVEGFPNVNDVLRSFLADAQYLLVDGLDEADPDRTNIADRLRRWALAVADRRVVLTTRPIGHNPSWFKEWKHYELLPLEQSNVSDFTKTIFNLSYPEDSEEAEKRISTFLEELRRSRTASVAARNPQLLCLLIALYINGYDIGGNRFQLFSNIVEEIRKQTRTDRTFQQQMDAPVGHRALNCTGWLMLQNPNISESDLIEKLGQQLTTELSLQSLQGQQIAARALLFWEERGLLERLRAGSETTFAFLHTAFQEFTASRFLITFPEKEFVKWIRLNHNNPRFRETLLLTGATKRLALTVKTLLELNNSSDPVCAVALLAADVLAEAEDSSAELQELVFRHLVPRLTSKIPMVVYEAAEKLRPLAVANPTLIGPMALELVKHEQQWIKEAACTLGILSGDEYVDEEELLAIFPIASDTAISSSYYHELGFYHKPLIRDLITNGAKYLLGPGAPACHVELVKNKYKDGNCSMAACLALGDLLTKHLSSEELKVVHTKWFGYDAQFKSWSQASREADHALLEAILLASESLIENENHSIPKPKMSSLSQLGQIFRIRESPMTGVYFLREKYQQDALVEVVRGAILVAALDPSQIKADAKQALHELEQSQNSNYLFMVTNSVAELDWTLAQNQRLQPSLLLKALIHPAWFVCRFAALLLLNCVERDIVSTGFQKVLGIDSIYNLEIIAKYASEVWQDQAASLILDRLEQNFTDSCTPLVKVLGKVCYRSHEQRVETILRKAFESKNAEIVRAALYTTKKLNLGKNPLMVIKNCYHWWISEGPQDPKESGIVPENAASSLLSYLAANRIISFEEMCEAANAKRSDIRSVAIKEIGRFLAEEDALVEPVIADINHGKLPCSILYELSKSYPNVCKQHRESFLKLLNSVNQQVQITCIYALSDGWAGYHDIQRKLRILIDSSDINIRDAAINTLRHLERLQFSNG